MAAARSAEGWARATTHNRAQILYYLAENLSARGDEFARRIGDMTGVSPAKARAEVEASIERLFSYGAWADKYEGTIHAPPLRGVALAMHEPIGVVGVACPDEAPLLGFISLVAPLIAMGNRVVAVPSERHPLAATDFYQVLETSDVPAGVVNIVTGERDALARSLPSMTTSMRSGCSARRRPRLLRSGCRSATSSARWSTTGWRSIGTTGWRAKVRSCSATRCR